MSRAAINRYAAVVLLGIAIVSAVALKLSLPDQLADRDTFVPTQSQVLYEAGDRL